MSSKRLTFPATEEAIRELRAGDEVLVDGHIIGIRDRTQIRIFDQGVEPPMWPKTRLTMVMPLKDSRPRCIPERGLAEATGPLIPGPPAR